jgi:uncharacterized membrane protein
MKRFTLLVAFAAALAVWANVASAEDKAPKDDAQQAASKEVKTVSGKSACATCDGVTTAGHNIMLVDEKGMRWVLVGSGDDYKKAHGVRSEGKQMKAQYKAQPKAKKDSDGKEYKEVEITKIEVQEKDA